MLRKQNHFIITSYLPFFPAQGLKVMYDDFINKGWQSSEIHIFVKPSRMTDVDRGLCDSLEKIGKHIMI